MKLNNLLARSLACGALVILVGCGGRVGIPAGPMTLARSTDARVSAIQAEIRLHCLRVPDTSGEDDSDSRPDFSTAYSQARRNHLVTAFLYAADESYLTYERRLFQILRQDNLGASTLSLLLSTMATTIDGHADIVRSLSAANSTLTGTHAAIGRDYLMGQTLQVMLLQMRANRARQRALILGRLGNTIEAWPLCIALSDALAFEQAGTLTEALVRTSENAANESRRNEEDVRNAIPTVQYTTGPLLDVLRNYFDVEDDDVHAARLTRALTAMNVAGLGAQGSQAPLTRLQELVEDRDLDAERVRLIREMIRTESDAEAIRLLSEALTRYEGAR